MFGALDGRNGRVFAMRKIVRAHPDLNQGPADLQSAALTTELCTHLWALQCLRVMALPPSIANEVPEALMP